MFDPILVPLDGSLLAECVLPHAVATARAFEAKVVLLRVLGQNQANDTTNLVNLVNWQIKKTEAKLYLERVGTQLKKWGLQTQTAVWEGLVAEWITEYAQAQKMKLIILSSHGQSGLSQWGISSVVQKIIYSAQTSLLIVRAHQPVASELAEQHYKQLLVALDGSQRAEYVLPMITLLARFHKAQIHIVHVVKAPEMARHMPLTREDVDLSNRIVTRNREEAANYLDQLQLRSPLDGINVQTHLLTSDNVATVLHRFVEQEHIDLVALSAHGYSGNNSWPYGSIVNNFIMYSKVPLLIVQDLPAKHQPIQVDVAVRERAGN